MVLTAPDDVRLEGRSLVEALPAHAQRQTVDGLDLVPGLPRDSGERRQRLLHQVVVPLET